MPYITEPGDLHTASGCTQTPLEQAAQLVPGAFLTGPAWQTVRRIVEVDRDVVMMEKVPANLVPAGHIHSIGRECECGLRRESVQNILPVTAGVVRSYVLIPQGNLLTPNAHTIYVTSNGQIVTAREGVRWSLERIPIIPQLNPIWTVPEALRRLVRR